MLDILRDDKLLNFGKSNEFSFQLWMVQTAWEQWRRLCTLCFQLIFVVISENSQCPIPLILSGKVSLLILGFGFLAEKNFFETLDSFTKS